MKIIRECLTCGKKAYTIADIEEFKKNKNKPYGVEAKCKQCDRDRRYAFYGITRKEYENMIIQQDNKCAICHSAFTKTPHIDHNHDNGKVRGILCAGCNHALGLFKDNTDAIIRAIAYVEKGRNI